MRLHGRSPIWAADRPLPSSDLVLAYQDVLFALQSEKGVNNGSPSLHARLLAELDVQIGSDRIVHVGAGTGYYSAILAELVGTSGHVHAVEMDPDLAAHAQAALADRANVSVVNADGSQWPQHAVDAIYVNFAVARPAEPWIERLRPGGRLVLPLGVPRQDRPPKSGRHASHGAALRIERGDCGFAARWIGTAYFVCANGGLTTDDNEIDALTAAFKRGGIEFVKSLLWKTEPRIGRCWHIGDQWAPSGPIPQDRAPHLRREPERRSAPRRRDPLAALLTDDVATPNIRSKGLGRQHAQGAELGSGYLELSAASPPASYPCPARKAYCRNLPPAICEIGSSAPGPERLPMPAEIQTKLMAAAC